MRKLLIVEDEGLIALDLQSELERAGYEVIGIADCMEEAIDLCGSYSPELVVMDIRIKGSHDGIETAERIRAEFALPVIFITAHADRQTLERAKLAEPFGYIVKPFINVDFRAQIETVLWKHCMEQKVLESEAWLASTLENVADGVIATDPDGNVTFLNAAAEQIVRISSESAAGRPLMQVLSLFDEKTRLPVVTPVEVLYRGGALSPEPEVYEFLAADGTRTGLLQARFSGNYSGERLLGVIACFQDITAQRALGKAMQEMEKQAAMSTLAGGISQELKSRVTRIQASLSALNADAAPDRRVLRNLQRYSAEAQTLLGQLELLAETEFHVHSVDLNGILTELRPNFQRTLGANRQLQFSLADDAFPIRSDDKAVRQILTDLIRQAKLAIPDSGKVEISTRNLRAEGERRVGAVQLTIRDSGKRLPQDRLDSAFKPFSARRNGLPNTGLSMTLVYHLVALTGGTIDVKSDQTAGTAFSINFPAVSAVPAVSAGA